jgi:parvulin-like peptidyl-prolyl isomerase
VRGTLPMVSASRNKLSIKFYRLVIWLTLLSMILIAGLPALFRSQRTIGEYGAVINGIPITYKELKRATQVQHERLALLRYQFEQMGLSPDPRLFLIDPQEIALETLIEQTLLQAVAQRLQLILDQSYVAFKLNDSYFLMQQLSNFAPSFLYQNPDLSSITHTLARHGLTISEFDAFVEQQLKDTLIKDLVSNSSYMPSFVLKNEYQRRYATKKLAVLIVPFEQVLQQELKKKVSDQELQEFFEAHKSNYVIPEKRDGVLWTFFPEHYAVHLSDHTLKAHYEAHKNSFIATPVRLKVRKITFLVSSDVQRSFVQAKATALAQELVKDPEQFARQAQEFSEDQATASKGGLVDFFKRGTYDPAFEQAAFRLKHDGDISPVINVGDRLEIIQRVERKAATYKSFEYVKEDIRLLLAKQEFKRVFIKDAEQALSQGDQALATFCKAKHAHHKELSGVTKDSTVMATKLFNVKTHGYVAYKDGEKGYLLYLTQIHKAAISSLDRIKDVVLMDFHTQRARQAWQQLLEQAKEQARVSLAQAAAITDGSVIHLDWLKEQDTERIKELKEKGYPVEKMVQLDSVGLVVSTIKDNKGYFARLEDIRHEKGDYKEKESLMRSSLIPIQGRLVTAGFIASLRRNATLELKEKTLASLKSK